MLRSPATTRGEIWTIAEGPGYAGKPRPAVIVQNDLYEATDSCTFCGLTTTVSESPITRPLIQAESGNGLVEASRVMVDKISTVRRDLLGRRIGMLSAPDMARVDRALLVFLGLAG